MQVKTKYDIGDQIYVLFNNHINFGIIVSVKIKGEDGNVIYYEVECGNPINPTHIKVSEQLAFSELEDFIANFKRLVTDYKRTISNQY